MGCWNVKTNEFIFQIKTEINANVNHNHDFPSIISNALVINSNKHRYKKNKLIHIQKLLSVLYSMSNALLPIIILCIHNVGQDYVTDFCHFDYHENHFGPTNANNDEF
jgi:hypothetical protein